MNWISVKDRMPPIDEWVVAFNTDDNNWVECQYTVDGFSFDSDRFDVGLVVYRNVSHWFIPSHPEV